MQHHYVYAHTYRGKAFYIGMGKGSRAYDVKDPSRGSKWKEYIKTRPGFKIHILEQFDTREDALAHEKELIKILRPITNSHGIRKPKKYIMRKPIKVLSEAGKRGAVITNSKLTPEKRAKAARKGWRNRKAKAANR